MLGTGEAEFFLDAPTSFSKCLTSDVANVAAQVPGLVKVCEQRSQVLSFGTDVQSDVPPLLHLARRSIVVQVEKNQDDHQDKGCPSE